MAEHVANALIIGALGDVGLQLIVRNSSEQNLYGLKTYFEHQGTLESIFTAAGMMGLFTGIYTLFDPDMFDVGLMIYGAALDIFFRCTRKEIMPSLNDYYEDLNPFMSIIWAIIPLLLVKYIRVV